MSNLADELIKELKALMMFGVTDPRHSQMIEHAMRFITPVIERIAAERFELKPQDEIDTTRAAHAISRFTGCQVDKIGIVRAPPTRELADFHPWWKEERIYNQNMSTLWDDERLPPKTLAASTADEGSTLKSDAIMEYLLALGYSTAQAINTAVNGMSWVGRCEHMGYVLWYATVFPILQTFCQTAAFYQRDESRAAVALLRDMTDYLPIGRDTLIYRNGWIILAAPEA
ncbi:MAG: hypothetical protein U9Q03_00545 [Patescibacteria group bacterium]|nr:hypothetical protein [Patescibacteria group bacterium]